MPRPRRRSRGPVAWGWAAATVLLGLSGPSAAHFGVVLPSTDIVGPDDARTVALEIMFMHPFTGELMDMVRPVRTGVRVQGERVDLLPELRPGGGDGPRSWSAAYTIRSPGDHVFFLEPEPYFEPVEQRFIVHYTKVVVHALGMESGWDEPLGLTTEIVPLTRPYGLWAGNVFQGQVLREGVPVPHAEVEVELLARGSVRAPAEPFVTQVVRGDADGVFTWGLPRPGWWGFAALTTDPAPRRHTDGRVYPVETGAVLWVRARAVE